MGQVLNDCLAPVFEYSPAKQERLEALQKGDHFTKSAAMGLAAIEIFVTLSQDTSTLDWKAVVKEDSWMAVVGKNSFGLLIFIVILLFKICKKSIL